VDAVIGELVRQGILGIVVAALILGWLVPKWVMDESRKREDLKDQIIARQSAIIERLAEKAPRAR
jgi:hypothetical protein